MDARNPRLEAQEMVGDDGHAWVLEPSPPAVAQGPWFSDDPVDAGNIDWHEWARLHPDHADWVADRWLAAYRRLPALPASLVETRLGLHRLAAYVVSPARRRSNGKIGLRWTLGGIGTPFFGGNEQVRISGTSLVRQVGNGAMAEPVTSLASAAELVLDSAPDLAWAQDFDVPDAGDLEADLAVDPAAAAFLGDWYGFAWSVLEELRADAASAEPSRVQLWPEHFDAAFDCRVSEGRATFGASPGDGSSHQPYLYVLPGGDVPRGDVWNACSFKGAVLPFKELGDAVHQRGSALEFLRSHRDLLTS